MSVTTQSNDSVQPIKVYNSFSVDNIETAFSFYSDTLSMDVERMPMGVLKLSLAGNQNGMILYPKPNHTPASYTVLNFEVANIDQAVDKYVSRGIVFEQYTGAMQTDHKGIFRSPGVALAWFKDPAGNIHALIQNS